MTKHRIDAKDIKQISEWFATRGGIAVWRSANLANPGGGWTAPINGPDGKPAGKPNWQAHHTPERLITDPSEVEIVEGREVRRFRVAIRHGDGMSITLSDAASRKVRTALAKAGPNSWNEFDYSAQEAVIMVPAKVVPLRVP